MNRFKNKLCFLLLAVLLGLGTAHLQPGLAAVVLQYGPSDDYVSANVNFQNRVQNLSGGTGAPGDPYHLTRAFNVATPLSPGANYSGPAFYGGYQLTSTSINPNPALSNQTFHQRVENNQYNSGEDRIRLQLWREAGWAGTDFRFAGAFLFQQADFSSPFDEKELILTGLSTKVNISSTGTGFTPMARWLIRLGNTYYVSSAAVFSSQGLHTASADASDLDAMQWAVYDPFSDLFFDAQSASFSAIGLRGLTAAGLYIDTAHYSGTADPVALELGIAQFGINADTIPEPTTLTLILLAALGLGYFRRHLAQS